MSLIAVVAGRDLPAESRNPAQPADGAHQATLERVFGRIFAVFLALMMVVFWSSSATLAGNRPVGVAADVLLSALLTRQALRTLRQRPSQRDLWLMIAATGALLLVSRMLAVRGSPFLDNNSDALVIPVAVGWAIWSGRFVVPVPVLLIIFASWTGDPGVPAVEQSASALGLIACTASAARLLRAGARQADADAGDLSRKLAAKDAVLAAEEAEWRAANAVHDDVLSVLRAAGETDQPPPWDLVVAKAKRALDAVALQVSRDGPGPAGLGSALRRQAIEVAAGLDVRCDVDDDLDLPLTAVEALSAAAGEALRNIAAHAGVDRAMITARGGRSGQVTVTVADHGAGFEPAGVGPARLGLRNSIRGRMADAGGHAEIISARGRGTSVVLTWSPPQAASVPAADPLAWGRRMLPGPLPIFVGLMLPILLLNDLVELWLRWPDMRWQAAAVVVLGGFIALAVLSARYLSQMRMTSLAAAALTTANTLLAAVGSLAVAPGTADSNAYWVSGVSGIVVATVYFARGPLSGLAALTLDLVALTTGMHLTGGAISPAIWASTLAGPPIAMGVAAALLAAFRGLSSRTESRLAEYGERVRLQARVEAISCADNAALENARRVAGPVLEEVASGRAPSPALRLAAALAEAALRDDLLAPGFLTPTLAERVRTTRAAGARIVLRFERQANATLAETARELLAAALADLDAGDEATLQLHPAAEGHAVLLVLHVRSHHRGHDALRRAAAECGAPISDLDDHELLIRLEPAR
ncbi:MAG TPA: hypothetical protein VKU77_15025 [Streptosporangiaceae bacterium]|nr:hypothetical protein [Streptosporangiaceae bacterium]